MPQRGNPIVTIHQKPGFSQKPGFWHNCLVKLPRLSAPLLLFLVTLLAYAPLVPFTGFYWDDWPYAWIARFLGLAEFIPASAQYRPFLAPNYMLTIGLVGTNPLAWQLLALLVRFLTGLSAWFALIGVWPARPRLALTASLLFLIFPGYSQQWVAVTHVNQELIPLLCYLLSFGLTARAMRHESKFWRFTLPALLLQIIGIFQTEYFFGMEVFRFFFIWAIASERTKGFRPRFFHTLKRWWPYLLIWIANAGWLYYFYKYGAYQSYAIAPGETAVATSATLSSLLQAWADALLKAGVVSWTLVFSQFTQVFPGASGWIAIGLMVAAFGLMMYARIQVHTYTRTHTPADTEHEIRTLPPDTRNVKPETSSPATRHPSPNYQTTQLPNYLTPNFYLLPIFTGLIGALAGRLPSWLGGLPLTLQSSYDRFMVSMMFGAALMLAGLLELFAYAPGIFGRKARSQETSESGRNWAHAIFASLLIALAVGSQFLSGNVFRRDWEGQRALYWQFAWRIPALEPGTIIFTKEMPLDYETDLSMTAPLNWMYAPDYQRGQDLPYVLLYTEKRLGGVTLPDLEPDTPILVPYRTVTFRGSVGKSITVYAPRGGCLRVLDPLYANAEVYAREPRALTDPIAASNPSRILVEAPAPEMPERLFGPEPEHTWCYFYEKAELARQVGHWDLVITLNEEAARLGYAAQDAFEWLPFIEAYARRGRFEEAERLTRLALDSEPRLRKGLCQVWGRVRLEAGAPAQGQERSEAMLVWLECRP